MSRLMISPAMHLAQLEIAWPEWHIQFSSDAGEFVAVLRAGGQAPPLTARHLGFLEEQLLQWDRAQR